MEHICSICYDNISDKNKDKEIIQLECNHKFHKDCFKKWFSINQSCPYCRKELYYTLISNFFDKDVNPKYKYNNYKRKSININNILTCFIEKQLKYKYIKPNAWVRKYIKIANKYEYNYMPLYLFNYDGNDIYISLYTRLVLLYESDIKNMQIKKEEDINGICYYKCNKELKVFNRNSYLVIIDWVLELLHVLKYEYDFVYHSVYNTIIFDLIIETIIKFNIMSSKLYQGITICSIWNILNYDGINISMEILNYYTDNTYIINDLEIYKNYQKNRLEKNLIIDNSKSTVYM